MVFCANEGHLNDVAVDKIQAFESALLAFAKAEYSDVMDAIAASGDWNDEYQAKFKELVDKFKATQTY
jgi:F-type H+-transporting ATPase subunit alpha